MPGPDYIVLRAAAELYSWLDQRLEQTLVSVRLAVDGFLRFTLTPGEKSDLTVRLYGHGKFAYGATLAPWEREWFEHVLPTAPARVLLGAAGDGREAQWLLEAGYTVDAFEPSAKHARELSRSLSGRAETERASYEELIAAAGGAQNALRPWTLRRYDAVILGWGSFTHVIDPGDHARLLSVCDMLAPEGPILASFWLHVEGGAPMRSRARALGATMGKRLGRIRGTDERVPDGELFRTHCGFIYEFTRSEIEAHAAAIGRSVEWGEYGYPHVTLVKSPARR